MRILVVCRQSYVRTFNMQCTDIDNNGIGKLIHDRLSGGEEECTVTIRPELQITNLGTLAWIRQNKGLYDVILWIGEINVTPLLVYILALLLVQQGVVVNLDTDVKCDELSLLRNLSAHGAGVNIRDTLEFVIAASSFIPPLLSVKTDHQNNFQYMISLKPNSDPWATIINWVCSQVDNSLLLYSVLMLAPRQVLHTFLAASMYCLQSGNVSPIIRERARKIMAQVDLVGPLVVPLQSTDLCDKITGLNWKRNSCYMDSPLHCMLAVPSILSYFVLNVNLTESPSWRVPKGQCGNSPANDLFNRQRLQTELRYITSTIRGEARPDQQTTNANKLRLIIRTCQLDDLRQWWTSGMQDSAEFVLWLLQLFPVNRGVSERITYATNNLEDGIALEEMKVARTPLIATDDSPVLTINRFTLDGLKAKFSPLPDGWIEKKDKNGRSYFYNKNKPHSKSTWTRPGPNNVVATPLSDFLIEVDDSGELDPDPPWKVDGVIFKRRISVKKLIRAPGAIIFNIERGGGWQEIGGGEASNVSTVPLLPE
jgi:hypothetical protein